MRVLIATDAWHPQINGVVRTLTSLARAAKGLGVSIEFLTPEGFPTVPLPTYANLRLAIPNSSKIARRIETVNPDAIHIATEGPIGFAARAICRRRGRPFTTSYTTCFPEYIAARAPLPESLTYAVLRRFHAAATVTMVSTTSLMNQLRGRGFQNLSMWTRGVDADLFAPHRAIPLDLPRPIFLTTGRIAVEKNLEAFLSLDLPGSKVVIGEGPQEAELRQRFRDVTFLGLREGPELAGLMAAADGVVQLEALACGIPVAAFPVMGPRDVIGGSAVGVLDEDLRAACLGALTLSREACRKFALTRSWATSARQFIANVSRAALHQPQEIRAAAPIPASARG